jgi:predicted CXXCH cytochrome family protein
MRKAVVLLAVLCLAICLYAEVKTAPAGPIKIDKLSYWFEGVTFNHNTHGSMACADCHHMGFDSGAGCGSCHSKDKTSPDEVSLKDAYHKFCSNCHMEKGKGVQDGCENCHKRKALPVPSK